MYSIHEIISKEIKELRNVAQSLGVNYFGIMRKSDLIFVILKISFLFCLLCQSISAQEATTFTVRGLLTDSIERQPLDALNVMDVRAIDSVSLAGAMSDGKGTF